MRVYLMGFMGAGKTTVGKTLAARLGWPFVDLDADVEATAGRSVREIFASQGEGEFRRLEREALLRTLERDPLVVATGGGTFSQAANFEAVAPGGMTVWLNPPFATIAARVGALGKEDRPLFGDETQALRLYRERLAAYRRADLTVDVGPNEQPEEIAARIELRLRERACVS